MRTADIAAHGYRIIRFWNNEVIENLDGVLETIRQELAAFPHHTPTLSAPEVAEREAVAIGRRGRRKISRG